MNKSHWPRSTSVLVLTAMLGGCASFGQDTPPAKPLDAKQLQLSQASMLRPFRTTGGNRCRIRR
ncbi:hypothetical protein [Paludibacterium denitrificans]|uniref:Lipoprotein n=1 Tax=Paludibacterium denitrificans TaxID=2675226 RepID=A0A844GDJ1_9NEIS|nr:hypothetical protein [Paludibacterium denitrificans]MTD33298.1 hypothetical protein [Paludibacterium denitrificans]